MDGPIYNVNDIFCMRSAYTIDEIIYQIVNFYSVKQVEDFLREKDGMRFEVDTKNSKGHSALAELVSKRSERTFNDRDKNVMELLLKHGADPLQLISNRYTLVGVLYAYHEFDLAMLFIRHMKDINCHIDQVIQSTPLHLALHMGDENFLRYVLSRNPDVGAMDRDGWSAFHMISFVRDHRGNRLLLAEILLEHCENLEVRNNRNGMTPLMMAVYCKKYELVEFLIKKGANLETRCFDGCTAFLLAVWWRRMDLVELLIRYGANIRVHDFNIQNALHCFFKTQCSGSHEKLFNFLLTRGCGVGVVNSLSCLNGTPLHLYLCDRCMCHHCTRNKNKYIKQLIEHGARLNIQDLDGNSVLNIAAKNETVPIDTFIYLMKNGADVSLRNRSNTRFFTIMMKKGRAEELVKWLVAEDIVGTFRFPQEIRSQINDERNLLNHMKACRIEVDLLNTKIPSVGRHLSRIQLYYLDDRKLADLCEEYSIRRALENFDVTQYPIYGRDIRRKFDAALKLDRTIYSCILTLENAGEENIDPETITNVTNLISNRQLNRIKEDLMEFTDN